MKKGKLFLMGIQALVLVFGLAFVSCGGGSGGDDGVGSKTSGSITITDIEAKYNGQYAVIRTSSSTAPIGGEYLYGCMEGSVEDNYIGGLIAGGQVTLPVYIIVKALPVSYNGNDNNMRLRVNIHSAETFNQYQMDGLAEVYTFDTKRINFTNGKASVSANDAD
jgi:hypothetical protein